MKSVFRITIKSKWQQSSSLKFYRAQINEESTKKKKRKIKTSNHLFVHSLESAAEFQTCCSLIGTENIIQVSVSFKETSHQCHIIAALLIPWACAKTKPSLQSHCLQSSHFCSSEPSLHCGVKSHSSPGSKQQPFAQVNCSVVHGAPHFSPVAHKHKSKWSVSLHHNCCFKAATLQTLLKMETYLAQGGYRKFSNAYTWTRFSPRGFLKSFHVFCVFSTTDTLPCPANCCTDSVMCAENSLKRFGGIKSGFTVIDFIITMYQMSVKTILKMGLVVKNVQRNIIS